MGFGAAANLSRRRIRVRLWRAVEEAPEAAADDPQGALMLGGTDVSEALQGLGALTGGTVALNTAAMAAASENTVLRCGRIFPNWVCPQTMWCRPICKTRLRCVLPCKAATACCTPLLR